MNREEALFESSIPTLGKSAIPLIVDRVRLAAEENDRRKIRLAVRSLDGQRLVDLKSHILEFLRQPLRLCKLAGTLLAQKLPDPEFLDLLWLVHCEFVNTDRELKEKDRSAFLDRKESFRALIANTKDNIGWLDDQIQNANPDGVPYHELVYVASNLPDPNMIWKKHKELIKEKVPKNRARSIATLIACVNDSSETEWLIENLDESDDWLGPSCLPPLFKIDPELALEHFDKMDQREMYFHREWFLPDLLLEFPQRGNEKILGMLQTCDEPWDLASVYSGNEDLMSVQVLDYLLGLLPKLVRDDMSLPKEPNKGTRIYHPISLLVNIYDPELLSLLRSSAHDDVDTSLSEWAIKHGGRSSLSNDLYSSLALKMLAKIGKSGVSKYVNSLLQHDSQYARLDALNFSTRNPDETTFELLATRALANELWDKFPLEQGYAAEALCEYGKWNSVVPYINKWGLESLTLIFDYTPEGVAKEKIEDYSERFLVPPLSASIAEVLSFMQDDSRLDEIKQVIVRDSTVDSELVTASVLSMSRFGVKDDTLVDGLAKFLNSSNNSYQATNSLLSNGSTLATEALLFSMEQQFDLDLAICLLNFESSKNAAKELIKQNLKSARGRNVEGEIQSIALRVSDDEVKRELLVDELDSIVNFVNQEHEGSFWHVGAKYDLLRMLALFAPDDTAKSLLKILSNHEFRDRELYPYLLVELIGDRATEKLWNLVVDEPWSAIRHSIGRTLATLDSEQFLLSFLERGAPLEKSRAIELLGFRESLSDEAFDLVDSLRRDIDKSVCQSAINAIGRIKNTEYTKTTVQQFMDSKDTRYRWQCLDLLCEFADLGDWRHPASWINEIELTPLQIDFLNKKVKARRKKIKDTLKRDDKRSMES